MCFFLRKRNKKHTYSSDGEKKITKEKKTKKLIYIATRDTFFFCSYTTDKCINPDQIFSVLKKKFPFPEQFFHWFFFVKKKI